MFLKNDLVNFYIKIGNHKVKGWLKPGAASIIKNVADIQETLNIKGHVCEIGVHHGRLFILLYLLTTKNENAVAIDIFDKQYLNREQSGSGNLDIFLKNLKAFAKTTEKLEIIAEDSTQLSADQIKNSVGGEVRLFSIDGGHTASITRNDLKIACKSICAGGVIILDDYFNEAWPGVSEGTNQFFLYDNHRGIAPFAIGGNKLLLTDANYADKYINLLKSPIANPILSRDKELFGHRVVYFDFSPVTLKQIIQILWKNIKDKPLGQLIKKSVLKNPQQSQA